MKKIFLFLLFLLCDSLAADKFIIAHRGASGYMPENTSSSMVLAHALGAQFLEFDLVLTKDDEAVIIHDLYLDQLSDVAKKFPQRKREDGHYYVIDFTLNELKTLRMSEVFTQEEKAKYPGRFPLKNSHFHISTLEEMIELIQGLNKTSGKNVGFFIEIKKPWFHAKEGKDIAKIVLEKLKKYDFKEELYFSCFDLDTLKRIKYELLPQTKVPLKLLFAIGHNEWKETYTLKDGRWEPFDYTPYLEGKKFDELSKIVVGVSPSFNDLLVQKKDKILANDFVKNAQKHGLKVITWTHRDDALPHWAKSSEDFFRTILFEIGADGIFTDFIDLGLKFLAGKNE